MIKISPDIKKSIIKVGIPLLLIVAIIISTVALASSEEIKIYKNISVSDYELESSSVKYTDAENCKYQGYKPVCKDGSLTMYVNETTSGVTVYDSKTNQYMNTILPEEELTFANPTNMQAKSFMLSNFVLTAVNMKTGNTSEYTMFDQLQSEGKFTIKKIDNGIRIDYLIGKIPKIYIVPEALSESRYLEIIGKLDKSDVPKFENRYKRFNIDNYHGSERKEYIEMYPTCEKETIYIVNNKKDFVLKNLQEILQSIGYTEEDKTKDEAAVLGNIEKEDYTAFRIPMEFTINDGHFSVSVIREDIRYSSIALPVYISVAPYLVSAYKGDNGYILLPDGSGSVMNLNNGKTNADSYKVTVFGNDPVYYSNFETEDKVSVRLPVFGLKKSDGGYFAHISNIGAEADILANVSGISSDTNYSFAEFKLFGYKKEMVSQDWTTSGNGTVYSVRIHGDKIKGKDTVDFYFLDKNANSYSDMATLYRNILKKNGTYKDTVKNSNPIFLDFLGVYDYTKSMLGVPVEGKKIMTDFEAANDIVAEISENNLSADFRYLAAVNGGYKQSIADKLKLESKLGNKSDLNKLLENIDSSGGKLYFDVSFNAVYKDATFDGFNRSDDSIGKINTKHSAFFEKDPVSFYYVKDPHFLLTPSIFEDNMNALLKDAKKLKINALSLRNIGSQLYSDADDVNFYTKSQTAEKLNKAIKLADESSMAIMYEGGNEYSLKFASYLSDVSPFSNNFTLTDGSVPFYQMVVCGYIPYSYNSLNYAVDSKNTVLFSVATGAKLKFDVSALNSSELKSTNYTYFYNTEWKSVEEEVINDALFVSKASSVTAGKELLSFDYIDKDISKSVFSDNVIIYVNYSAEDYSIDGKVIPAENYLIVS